MHGPTRGLFQDEVPAAFPRAGCTLGLNVLKMYPSANSPETIGQGYNYLSQESTEAPRRQDLVRLDWAASANWRVYGKYLHTGGSGWNPYGGGTTGFSTNIPTFGSIGACPCSQQITLSADATLNGTTVMEVTWGSSYRPIKNYAHTPEALEKSALGLTAFPMLYPDAVQRDYVPSFNYGGRIGTFSPTNNTQYAPFENYNITHDVNASITKIMGRHTGKAGLFLNHALKSQSSRAFANGLVSFQNDASNPLDTGYPFANAAIGVYQTYSQAAQWVKGNYVYNNLEWYLQDNWRKTDKLTLTTTASALLLAAAHLRHGSDVELPSDQCDVSKHRVSTIRQSPATNAKVALDRATGAHGSRRQHWPHRPRIQERSSATDSFRRDRASTSTCIQNRGIHYAPRFGLACDVTGVQQFVVRGGAGIFYDRAAGDTVYPMIEQRRPSPPNAFLRTPAGHLVVGGHAGASDGCRVRYGEDSDDLRIQRRRSAAAAMVVSARHLVRGFQEPQPEHAGQPQRTGVRRRLPRRESGSDDRRVPGCERLRRVEHGTWRERAGSRLSAAVSWIRRHHPDSAQRLRRLQLAADFVEPPVPQRLLVRIELRARQGHGDVDHRLPGGQQHLQSDRHRHAEDRQRGESADGELHAARHRSAAHARRQLHLGSTEVERTRVTGAVLNGWQFSGVYRAGSGTPYTPTCSIPGISVYDDRDNQARKRATRDQRESGSGHNKQSTRNSTPRRLLRRAPIASGWNPA